MTAAEKREVRERASPEVWRERVERWKSSGLRAKEFAAAENLSPRSLSWWQWQLRRQSTVRSAAPQKQTRKRKKRESSLSFVPVVLRAAESTVSKKQGSSLNFGAHSCVSRIGFYVNLSKHGAGS
jgi:hypothetical protein